MSDAPAERSGYCNAMPARFSQLAHQTSDFLVIRRTFYKQTFIKTEGNGHFIDSAPISSRFYEYLFGDCYDYRMKNLSIR